MEIRCPLCKNNSLFDYGQRAMQACEECARQLGIIPMPPLAEPVRPCRECKGRQFVRVIPREHSTRRWGDTNTQVSAPMYVTHAPNVHEGWLGRSVQEVEIESTGAGLLQALICRGCGDVRWNCIGVESIPIGPHYMTETVEAEPSAPYR